jgi:1-acyl-sn-glycerol-3-phosphate acyltransferase
VSIDEPVNKPRAQVFRPELVRLPPLTPARRVFRQFARLVCRLLALILLRREIVGLEHFPSMGPCLVVVNHLGDTDAFLGIAYFPKPVDGFAKMELHDFPILGKLMEAYGAIWVHRGTPDRKAIRAALDGFKEGRLIGIAPEGRESLTGALEEGTGGAAYLAWKARVPCLPVTFTGTANRVVYGSLKRFRRPHVTMTIGPLFWLEDISNRSEAIRVGTDLIMHKLAQQLPSEYQGVYKADVV